MAPSTLGPVVMMQDNLPLMNEISSIRLPIDMSLGDTTNPPTWSGTEGHGLGKPHSCIVLSAKESSKDLSSNSSYCVHLGSADEQRKPTINPGRLRYALVKPKVQAIERNIARCPCRENRGPFSKQPEERLGISPNSSLMLTPTTGSSLNAASAISPGPSSVFQASPSLPHAVSAKGTMARTWSQVVGQAAHKKAADKAATEKAAAETQRGSYEEEFPRYVGRSASLSPIAFDDTFDYPGALVIYCPDEMAYEPWNDSDDNRSSSPPPPILFLVEMEVEATIAQSSKDVKLWFSKI